MRAVRGGGRFERAMLVSAEALKELPLIDSVVFDIDGVLIDVSESFSVVTCEAVRLYAERILSWEVDAPLLTPSETELIKSAGGFNSDWDVAKAVMLFYIFKRVKHGSKRSSELRSLKPSLKEFVHNVTRMGGGFEKAESYILSQCNIAMRRTLAREWSPRLVIQLFQELYGGDEWCEYLYGFQPQYVHGAGYIERERVLIDVGLIPKNLKLGILTGRTKRETELALRRCGLSELIPQYFWMTDDDGFRKPDGRALWLLLDRLGAGSAVYVGDRVDDLMTVQNYREWVGEGYPKVIFCAVLGSSDGENKRRMFLERGADMVSPDVNFFLSYVRSLRELRAAHGAKSETGERARKVCTKDERKEDSKDEQADQ
ncbi:MAG: HAD family hydrolase [Armatimonadota bacterium]|nr:HAD family hydrolase [Armatimonadota bacterium]MCX7778057.1 HAD family hydrolase [Armatimonadota bacterium]MDW8026059.1 HAD family hydrolase [Armatimonadota bacterium]